MGHADIATTMIYVHHVPQHDAAGRLTELLRERTAAGVRCTAGASPPEPKHADESEPARTSPAWPVTKALGLSLGDRACLALARRLGIPALTADRIWADAELQAEERLIR